MYFALCGNDEYCAVLTPEKQNIDSRWGLFSGSCRIAMCYVHERATPSTLDLSTIVDNLARLNES